MSILNDMIDLVADNMRLEWDTDPKVFYHALGYRLHRGLGHTEIPPEHENMIFAFFDESAEQRRQFLGMGGMGPADSPYVRCYNLAIHKISLGEVDDIIGPQCVMGHPVDNPVISQALEHRYGVWVKPDKIGLALNSLGTEFTGA